MRTDEELDAIDREYLRREHQTFVWLRAEAAKKQDAAVLADLSKRLIDCTLLLPAGYRVELVEPRSPHPFELARWADDGGRI